MIKNKEWFKQQMVRNYPSQSEIDNPDYEIIAKVKIIDEVLSLIDQVDEPEKVVVSKMEKVVIPQFVADWIEESKGVDDDFWEAATEMIRDSITSLTKKGRKVHDWLFGNSVIVTVMLERQKLITRAWLDGYAIEKEPDKLYEVKLPTENAMGNTMNLVQGGSKNRVWFDSLDDRIVKFKFTEQEIKAIDERYWSFAKEVTDNV